LDLTDKLWFGGGGNGIGGNGILSLLGYEEIFTLNFGLLFRFYFHYTQFYFPYYGFFLIFVKLI
jgi:hypothetical protein